MRRLYLALAISIFPVSGYAQPAAQSAKNLQPQTRVETDEETGTIRFIVKGKEQARIDDSGFHVREAIEYGGTMTDSGSVNYAHQPEKAKQ